jgi:hypothetical protein
MSPMLEVTRSQIGLWKSAPSWPQTVQNRSSTTPPQLRHGAPFSTG